MNAYSDIFAIFGGIMLFISTSLISTILLFEQQRISYVSYLY